jgi:hypothetical protein
MNRSILVGAVMALAGAMPLAAQAQAQEAQSTGVDLHLGVFFPVGSTARSNATAWLAYGASYRLLDFNKSVKEGTHSSLSISADYMGQDHWSQAPICLNYNVASGPVWVSGGAGFGFASEPSGSGTDFAYQASIGYNFPSTGTATMFVKAQYWGSDRTELDGFAAYVGVRF